MVLLKNWYLTYNKTYVLHYQILQLYLRLGLKLQKVHHVLESNQSQLLKPMTNLTKKNRSRKPGDKNAKALGSFMNNPVYSKTIENLRNRTDVRLARNKKYYLTWTSKPGYMSKKIFDYYLVAICKSKVTLTLTNQHMLRCPC